MTETNTLDLEKMRARLEARLEELIGLNESAAQARAPVALDQARVGRLSRMDAMQNQQIAAETARRRDMEIGKVKAALSRLDRGEYGYCLKCEEDMDLGRLEFDPAATLCITCARGAKL